MTSQPGKDTVAVHIWPNTSRSKGNLTRIFCQLIKYNLRRIFLKNHSQNLVEKLFKDPFLKTKIEHISGTTDFAFIVCQVAFTLQFFWKKKL